MNFDFPASTRRIPLLIMGCMMIAITSVGQGPGGDGDLGNEPDVPVDGGVSLLLAAGAVYGIRKMRRRQIDRKDK